MKCNLYKKKCWYHENPENNKKYQNTRYSENPENKKYQKRRYLDNPILECPNVPFLYLLKMLQKPLMGQKWNTGLK